MQDTTSFLSTLQAALPTITTGLTLSLSLIVAIGAQNTYVLRQGLRREHVLAVVMVCALLDMALMTLGVSGLAATLGQHPREFSATYTAVVAAGMFAGEPQELAQAISARQREGLTIEANFVGLREMTLEDADYDATTRIAEITVRFTGELTSVVKNAAGDVVDGHPTSVKRQRDAWTFARPMGVQDPNWQLVATGD